MAYEYKEGQINVFKNDKKQEGSNQPDYRGKLMIGGVMKEVSLWVKESGNGTKYMGGQISNEYKKPETSEEPKTEQDNSGLPF